MKDAAKLAAKLFDFEPGNTVVHYRLFEKKIIPLATPAMSEAMQCLRCNGKRGLTAMLSPDVNNERVWFCISHECTKLDRMPGKYEKEQEPKKRVNYWTKWREANDVGDIWSDLSGKIEQSTGVIKALHNFALQPAKVMILSGHPGTGKTYCAMKVIAYYLQSRSDAIFFTSATLKEKWMQAMNDGTMVHLMHKLREYSLLVIDDFGQLDPTPGYMGMIFDLLNSRLQWKDRGTILTTNQSPEALLMSVGQAMSDRLRSQQWILFNGESKR